ncbi:MAG: hypothetical protein J6D57_08235 [Mogibacterium sp.]|nr:hypothetical protein [Mogibacterium sp.]
MTKINRKTLRLIATALCVVMIVLGGLIARTAAALIEGDEAQLEMGMATLDVQLTENDTVVADGTTEGKLFSALADTVIDPGYTYEENIAVRNSGASPEYVRVIIRKYWTDDSGKVTDAVSPESIELVTGSGWFENAAESSTEQSVYYCSRSLDAGTDSAPLFTGIRVNGKIADAFTIAEDPADDKVLKATFAYDGLSFNVEAEVQAIQYDHANEAAGSAWGITNIVFADGRVTLK